MMAAMGAAIALTAGAMISSTAEASPIVGQAAPDFSVVDAQGTVRSLDEFKGSKVILEWTNHGCPFVQKHYDDTHSNMQSLQSEAKADGVVWLTVLSSAPGKQGYLDGAGAMDQAEATGATPSHILLDPTGTMGKAYDAKTTPHMFIIDDDEAQTLVYAGAIDDRPGTNPAEIPNARNYVKGARASLESGEVIDPATTKPYGCSVKYAS